MTGCAVQFLSFYGFIEMRFVDERDVFSKLDSFGDELVLRWMTAGRATTLVIYIRPFSYAGIRRGEIGKQLGQPFEFGRDCVLLTRSVMTIHTCDIPVLRVIPGPVILLHDVARTAEAWLGRIIFETQRER